MDFEFMVVHQLQGDVSMLLNCSHRTQLKEYTHSLQIRRWTKNEIFDQLIPERLRGFERVPPARSAPRQCTDLAPPPTDKEPRAESCSPAWLSGSNNGSSSGGRTGLSAIADVASHLPEKK
ncbi:unnamed protein product, partial [Trichogramma brassicae]